jgi:hypothetical protein
VAAVIHHGLEPAEFRVGQGTVTTSSSSAASHRTRAPGRRRWQREAGVRALLAAKMREPEEVEYFHDEVEPLLDDDVRYIGEVDFERSSNSSARPGHCSTPSNGPNRSGSS